MAPDTATVGVPARPEIVYQTLLCRVCRVCPWQSKFVVSGEILVLVQRLT